MLELNVSETTETEAKLRDYELSIDSYGDTIRVDTETMEEGRTGQLVTPEATPEPEKRAPTTAKQAPITSRDQNHSHGQHHENTQNTQNSTTTSA